ncbi:MAG: xanthine dehydrogenase family protein molybdopterin-binding subunit, partial [Bacilli bacterium]
NQVQRNICASGSTSFGDLPAAYEDCDVVLEKTYHSKANAQAMMENFCAHARIDHQGRIEIVTSTQIPFHARRIVARSLGLSTRDIKVIKPRIGGGFGAKQTVCVEIFAAFATYKLQKPCKIIYSRQETLTTSNSRHEMFITVKIGAKKDGTIKVIELDVLSNTGAYGEHGSTTVGLSAFKSMPLYNVPAGSFKHNVVYTNTMRAGAFRGYGATQGLFALESLVNELARELNMDAADLRLKNILRKNDTMVLHNLPLTSTSLRECIIRAKELSGYTNEVTKDGHYLESYGLAIAMQGSGIAKIDVASSNITLHDDGFFVLSVGAPDVGTGSDRALAQIAAETLETSVDNIIVVGIDTDTAPFDTGAYASSTTYVSGNSVVQACKKLKQQLLEEAAKLWETSINGVYWDQDVIKSATNSITLRDLSN